MGGCFAIGNQDTDSTLTAGGGTYEYDGQTYTENIEYFTVPSLVGQSIKFDIRLEESKWLHSGTIPGDGWRLKVRRSLGAGGITPRPTIVKYRRETPAFLCQPLLIRMNSFHQK